MAAVKAVSTSNQWTTLPGFVTKVNRKLPPGTPPTTPRALADLLASVTADELRACGVWLTWFGADYMPIIATNPAYARARAAVGSDAAVVCSCGAGGDGGSTGNFFGSNAYNAGRHSSESSGHKANCLCWSPPTTSHLHSWRLGY